MRFTRDGTASARRGGHTLVELVVACVVFALGVFGLQRAMLLVLTQARDARQLELAVQSAADRHEPAVHSPCTTARTGSTQLRGLRIEWTLGPRLGEYALRTGERVLFTQGAAEREHRYSGAVRCR